MLNKSVRFIAALMLCGAAYAEPEVIGKVTEVDGLVTVSSGTSVSTVALGSPIVDEAHYVTSSTGSATLKFDNGCEIKLKPNQSVTARREVCELLLASVLTGDNATLGVGLVLGVGVLGSIPNSPISGQ